MNMGGMVFSTQKVISQPPPGDPPDSEGSLHGNGQKNKTVLGLGLAISFRDKVLGNKQAPSIREKSDLIAQKMVRVEYENGNRLLPKVYLDDKVFHELCSPWHDALVVKLLGKNIGYRVMQERLKKLWKLTGGFDMMDVDNGFYMIKFDLEADKEKVKEGGPWMLFAHCLAVTNWSPEFVSPTATVDHTLVWIRFPGLNLVYYDESFLLALASTVGRPIRVDTNTLKVERGRFARICVEIDLTKPVVGKVWLRGHWYKVQYEGLHLICAGCGCYGHLARNCLVNKPPMKEPEKPSEMPCSQVAGETVKEVSTSLEKNPGLDTATSVEKITGLETDLVGLHKDEEEIHGEWMIVTRKKRSTLNGKDKKKGNVISRGNKYEELSKIGNLTLHGNGKESQDLLRKAKESVRSDQDGPHAGNRDPKNWNKLKKRRHDTGSVLVGQLVANAIKARDSQKSRTQVQDVKAPMTHSKVGPAKTNEGAANFPHAQHVTNVPTPVASSPKILDPQIKTVMNIEQVGPNQFRFVDDDQPPDPGPSCPMQITEHTTEFSEEYVEETQQGCEVAMEVAKT